MTNNFYRILNCLIFVLLATSAAYSQVKPGVDSAAFYQTVNTYVNPVLPGDHPDPTLLKVGNDFYHCGSSFHFNPYLPVYHSKDLVHWQVISRVLPADKAGFVTDRPSAGVWQGAITYFYGSYWIYFSANGQWFSKASSPAGPWSAPVQVKTNPVTGNLGYDNSIFIDDDGKPYMVIKNGQKVNRLQELGKDGQLTGEVINMDWVNARLQYSWAEGPVMCKRNGFYYYFPAGDVTGGQYVLRGTSLTGDSTKWVRLGNFFKPVTDVKTGFRRPNHISAPFQLSDGTWWTIGQSYEKYDGNDWSGMGRQTALYPVTWEGDRPWGAAPTTQPIIRPDLPRNNIPWRTVKTDYFNSTTLDLNWHFLTKKAGSRYSLNERSGWLRLRPDTTRTHLVQKETDHYYTAVTRVDFDANVAGEQAGLYLTSGNQKVSARLFSGYEQGQKIVFELDTARRSIPNTFGQIVWLKLERSLHLLRAYCSKDGKTWVSLGAPISAIGLDKTQPNYNSWVGTSIGLFAEGKVADFDCFICKDGTAAMPVAGYSNYYGVKNLDGLGVTNTSVHGGWLMLSGVELGNVPVSQVYIKADAKVSGQVEIWLDDLGRGKLVATIPVKAGSGLRYYRGSLKGLTGQHDVFIKFPAGSKESVTLDNIRFSN